MVNILLCQQPRGKLLPTRGRPATRGGDSRICLHTDRQLCEPLQLGCVLFEVGVSLNDSITTRAAAHSLIRLGETCTELNVTSILTESCRQVSSLLLYLCYVFRVLINSRKLVRVDES